MNAFTPCRRRYEILAQCVIAPTLKRVERILQTAVELNEKPGMGMAAIYVNNASLLCGQTANLLPDQFNRPFLQLVDVINGNQGRPEAVIPVIQAMQAAL